MKENNEIILEFGSQSENESLARVVVSAYMTRLDPTIEELADVKTAVSEAVTNCVIHGYPDAPGNIQMKCKLDDNVLYIEVTDHGVGISDIEKAMEPLYTTRPEMERSGMGFAFMEAFMDELEVISVPGEGTTVKMNKKIGSH
ncbi:anti-sigma F factor [Anaerolentibacter hominis]|uniref:anti-sigma F factor n=1 Tax=Anaerolentibacter hominis TaxID=3079009 RepID=UPI0031B8A7F9